MIQALQAATVGFFDAARATTPTVAGGILAPKSTVRPYGGELLSLERLVLAVPALYVELGEGEISPLTSTSSTLQGEHTVTLILATQNLAGWEAAAHDGARLMGWALHVLQQASLTIPVQIDSATRYARVLRCPYQRLVSDKQIWAGQLDLVIDFNA